MRAKMGLVDVIPSKKTEVGLNSAAAASYGRGDYQRLLDTEILSKDYEGFSILSSSIN